VAVDLLRRVRAKGGPPDPLIDAGLATASFLLGRYDEVESLARPVRSAFTVPRDLDAARRRDRLKA
jgi:hypothetical protein